LFVETDAVITKDIINFCVLFFGLYLSCTSVALLFLIDGSTYWLFKVMVMFLSVMKMRKFFLVRYRRFGTTFWSHLEGSSIAMVV